MRQKLSWTSAALMLVSGVVLITSMFLPWWGMTFIAPQYPEGLSIIVYPYKMAGKVDIINGLNHYIGMRNFSEESFPELKALPYIIGMLALFIAIAALIRRRSLLYICIALYTVGGALGLYDIHRWLSDYGTKLDPKAPIKIAPFVPPILGENRIANFVTHSYFSYGALLLAVSFVLLLLPLWKDRTR